MRNNLIKSVIVSLLILFTGLMLTSCDGGKSDYNPANDKVIGENIAELTSPPNVPPPIDIHRAATKQIVNMEVLEEEGTMTDGVKYTYWTFGGSVPGSFIRIREGDEYECHSEITDDTFEIVLKDNIRNGIYFLNLKFSDRVKVFPIIIAK